MKLPGKLVLHLLFFLWGLKGLTAQNLALFELNQIEDSTDTTAFVSLSDIYPLSENMDSLAIPDLSEKNAQEADKFEYFKLGSEYRNRFLSRTRISESDKVFIYSYEKNILISFAVKNLNVVACLNIYGADWPYRQEDYMIGFEIDRKQLTGFENYFANTLVYIGKKSPFVLNQLKPVLWIKMDAKDFPSKEPLAYDTSYAGKCYIGDAYRYETNDLQYFLQDMNRVSDNWNSVKYLLVIDKKSKKTVCEKVYYAGESATFAPVENHWTGKLFKNYPPVILGIHWVSFVCPGITFLNSSGNEISIYCDNRH